MSMIYDDEDSGDEVDPMMKLEDDVRDWLEEMSGEKLDGDLGDELHDGIVICKALNAAKPGLIKQVAKSSMPFKQMENIQAFIKACRSIGVEEYNLFSTSDLFEKKNMKQVIMSIFSLGGVLSSDPAYRGPKLGLKRTTKAGKSSTASKEAETTEKAEEAAAPTTKWRPEWDYTYNTWYYVNNSTGESQWEVPEDYDGPTS